MRTPDTGGKTNIGRSVGAVLAGYIVIGILVVLTDQIWSRSVPGFSSLPQPPTYYFAITLLTDFLYSAVGGWVAIRIGQRRQLQHAVGLIIFGELIGIATQIALWSTVPHWYGVSILILYPVGVWLGAKLAIGKGTDTRSVAASASV
jgi:hypothetical protein